MKNKSIVPVSYLYEATQLQKEEEKTNKVEISNDKSLNAIKKNDNMEGKCKQIHKSPQGKEYSCLFCFEN